MKNTALPEVWLIPPRRPCSSFSKFLAYLVYAGVDFAFEEGDNLPTELPPSIGRHRLLLLHRLDAPRFPSLFAEFPGLRAVLDSWDRMLPVERDQGRLADVRHRSAATVLCLYDDYETYADRSMHEHWIESMIWAHQISHDSTAFKARLKARPTRLIADAIFEEIVDAWRRCGGKRWGDYVAGQANAVLDYFEITGNAKHLDAVGTLIQTYLQTPVAHRMSSLFSIGMAWPMLRLARLTHDNGLRRQAIRRFERLLNEYAWHEGAAGTERNDRWHRDSSTLLAVAGLALAASQLKNPRAVCQKVARHCLIRDQRLRDRHTGLYRFCADQRRQSPGLIGHGTYWNLLGLERTIENLPSLSPQRDALLPLYRNLACAATRYQGAEGLWHQTLNQSSTPTCTLYSGAIVAALARGLRAGILGSKFEDAVTRGTEALKTRVFQGAAVAISGPIGISARLDYYTRRPLVIDMHRGNWQTAMAFAAALALEGKR